MVITQRGLVRTATAMANIDGGECVPPSMRTSVVVTEKSASAELNAVAEERGLEPRNVHGDGGGEPGFCGKSHRPLKVEALFELGVGAMRARSAIASAASRT